MARLSDQVKLSRLHAQGYSDRQIANATGFSPSSIGRMRRGEQSSTSAKAAIAEFYSAGKRTRETFASGSMPVPSAKAPPAAPSRSAAPPSRETRIIPDVTPLERAAGALTQFDRDTQVVVYVDMKDGTRHVLYSKGGIEAGEIRGNLRGSIASQGARQYGGFEIEWDDVSSIEIEEY